MTRALTRTPFHSSRLIRVLADLARLQTLASGNALAQKLALWVDYTDAIALCAVHNAGPYSSNGSAAAGSAPTTGPKATSKPAPDAAAQTAAAASPATQATELEQELARLRASLESGIGKSSLPAPDPEDSDASAFEAFRRYYATQQRDMEQKVGPLRAKVRERLGQTSPALKQLAALDAALDGILCERESRLLYGVPLLLKKRFAHLRTTYPAGTGLLRFGQELQTVLRAELDVRLQPTQGLLEALHNPTTQAV